MGLQSRIRLGMAKILASQAQQMAEKGGFTARDLERYTRRNSSENLNLHQIKLALNYPRGGYSQPVWGPEINTVGAYSREGYTSKTFDIPSVPFSSQVQALQVDEDVQLAVNHLSSQITGGEHYWKSKFKELQDYMTDFTDDIAFDELGTTIVKELLWYGNSVIKPRLGIENIRSRDDIMHIPISSFVRVWWDRQRIPYKYEFRGADYQGYHNPQDVIHFKWNPINASAFGTGFGIAMTTTKPFQQITPNGPEAALLPSLLDRKYSQQLTMHITERRYIPHNVYNAIDSEVDERAAMSAALQNLKPGEDFVTGTKVEVQELGSAQRAFDPTLFLDLVQGPIMKAMNDFRGKDAGQTQHSYANAKTSAVLDEIGLSAFIPTFKKQLNTFLFKPWYESNPYYSDMYLDGIIAVPWRMAKFEMNFGHVQKKDLSPEQFLAMIDSAVQNGAVQDIIEMRELYEDGGLPLRKEFTQEMNDQYNNYNAMPSDMDDDQPERSLRTGPTGMGGDNYPGYDSRTGQYFGTKQDRSSRPMEKGQYRNGYDQRFFNAGQQGGKRLDMDAQPSKPYLNFDEATAFTKLKMMEAKKRVLEKLSERLDD